MKDFQNNDPHPIGQFHVGRRKRPTAFVEQAGIEPPAPPPVARESDWEGQKNASRLCLALVAICSICSLWFLFSSLW